MSTLSTLIARVEQLAIDIGNALQLRGFKTGGTAGQVPVKGAGGDFDWSWGDVGSNAVSWESLTGKPAWTGIFDGGYASLNGKPTLGGAAALNVGTTAGAVAAGDHNHSGVYQPVITNYSTISGLTGYPTSFPNTAVDGATSSAFTGTGNELLKMSSGSISLGDIELGSATFSGQLKIYNSDGSSVTITKPAGSSGLLSAPLATGVLAISPNADGSVARAIETITTTPRAAVVGGRYIAESGSASITDPTTRVDGSALQAGDSYEIWVGGGSGIQFNGTGTTYAASRFSIRRRYNGSAWVTPTPTLSDSLTVPGITVNGTAAGTTGIALLGAASVTAALSSVGIQVKKRTTDSAARTNTATPSVDDQITTFSFLAGRTYKMEWALFSSNTNANGFQAQLAIPSANVFGASTRIGQYQTAAINTNVTTSAGGIQMGFYSTTHTALSHVGYAFIQCNVNGNYEFQWAQASSGASDTKLLAGSVVRITDMTLT